MASLNTISEENQLANFMQRIEAGEKIEADDWMPEDYRQTLIKLISMHGMSEIMGALPEKRMGTKSSFSLPKARHYGKSSRRNGPWPTPFTSDRRFTRTLR